MRQKHMNIPAVATSITVMIGGTTTGPLNQATLVNSFAQFQTTFGALQTTLELGYSVMLFFANGGQQCWVVRQGTDMDAALNALDTVAILNLLCAPGVTDSGLQAKIAAYAEKRMALALLDAEVAAANPSLLLQYAQSSTLTPSQNAALFGPWLQLSDPLSGQTRTTAPSGAVAGIYARHDAATGVWKSPAGQNASLLDITGVEFAISTAQDTALANAALNTIRTLPGVGTVVWGARTRSLTGDYKYVAVKRMALFLEQSLTQGLQWVAFEPNAAALWALITNVVSAFLNGLFHQGAFQGTTPQQSYFVKCDATTTTQADINAGVVKVLVGFAPLKPAEFVILNLQFLAGSVAPAATQRELAQ
jgi:phage tail sheath protein FI